MANETTITIVGNITSDPELRYTQNGVAVAGFTVAQAPKFFDKQSNDWKEGEPLFMRCSVWREFAEHVAGSLSKGQRVVVQGMLQSHSYETKEGEKRTGIELKVEAIGPDLRYVTVQVTRAGGTGSGTSAPNVVEEPWAASTPGQGYNDETPF